MEPVATSQVSGLWQIDSKQPVSVCVFVCVSVPLTIPQIGRATYVYRHTNGLVKSFEPWNSTVWFNQVRSRDQTSRRRSRDRLKMARDKMRDHVGTSNLEQGASPGATKPLSFTSHFGQQKIEFYTRILVLVKQHGHVTATIWTRDSHVTRRQRSRVMQVAMQGGSVYSSPIYCDDATAGK